MRGTLLTVVRSRRLVRRLENGWVEMLELSVNGQLVSQVVENLVGRGGQTAGVGKGEMGSDEEVWEVVGVDVSSDGLVVASGASVFENSLVVAGINPHSFERSGAEGGVGCSEIGEVENRFCGGFDAGEVERGGRITSPADCNECAGSERRRG